MHTLNIASTLLFPLTLALKAVTFDQPAKGSTHVVGEAIQIQFDVRKRNDFARNFTLDLVGPSQTTFIT